MKKTGVLWSLAGAVCGVGAYPLTAMIFQHRISVPHNPYQLTLLICLMATGAGIAWLLARASHAPLRGGEHGSHDDIHPYVSVGIGDHAGDAGGDGHDDG